MEAGTEESRCWRAQQQTRRHARRAVLVLQAWQRGRAVRGQLTLVHAASTSLQRVERGRQARRRVAALRRLTHMTAGLGAHQPTRRAECMRLDCTLNSIIRCRDSTMVISTTKSNT